jgi:hypothetical protein
MSLLYLMLSTYKYKSTAHCAQSNDGGGGGDAEEDDLELNT